MSPELQKSRVTFVKNIIRTTTLLERKTIEEGIALGKTYGELSKTLNLSLRVVRKWGQKVKKK